MFSEADGAFGDFVDPLPQDHSIWGHTQPIETQWGAGWSSMDRMIREAEENPVVAPLPRYQRPKLQWPSSKLQLWFCILLLSICLFFVVLPLKGVSVHRGSVADHQYAQTMKTILDIRGSHTSHNSNVFLEFYVSDASTLGQIHTDTNAALLRLQGLCLLPDQLAEHASSANLWKRRVQRSSLPLKKEIDKMLVDVEALSYPVADVGTDLCASMNEAVLQ